MRRRPNWQSCLANGGDELTFFQFQVEPYAWRSLVKYAQCFKYREVVPGDDHIIQVGRNDVKATRASEGCEALERGLEGQSKKQGSKVVALLDTCAASHMLKVLQYRNTNAIQKKAVMRLDNVFDI